MRGNAHYLNYWRPNSSAHKCVTTPQCFTNYSWKDIYIPFLLQLILWCPINGTSSLIWSGAELTTIPWANHYWCGLDIVFALPVVAVIYRWLSARLQYLQCVSNGDTTVLHQTIDIFLREFHCNHCNDVSAGPSRVDSPTNWFVQKLVQDNNGIIKTPHHWPFVQKKSGFPAQQITNEERVVMSWHYNVLLWDGYHKSVHVAWYR